MIRKLWLSARAREKRETPDPTPLEAVGLPAPPTVEEQIRQWVRYEVAQHAMATGEGTFEDEDDFELDDDELPRSPYEEHYLDLVSEDIPSSEDQAPADVAGVASAEPAATPDAVPTEPPPA